MDEFIDTVHEKCTREKVIKLVHIYFMQMILQFSAQTGPNSSKNGTSCWQPLNEGINKFEKVCIPCNQFSRGKRSP